MLFREFLLCLCGFQRVNVRLGGGEKIEVGGGEIKKWEIHCELEKINGGSDRKRVRTQNKES